MTATSRELIEQCVEDFRQSKLTEDSLRHTLEQLADGEPKHQDLLYLQVNSDYPGSHPHGARTDSVVGMMIMENGDISEGPADPDDWPYKSIKDALDDGWRIIKFPEMALLMDESRTYGLGSEFILEKWRS